MPVFFRDLPVISLASVVSGWLLARLDHPADKPDAGEDSKACAFEQKDKGAALEGAFGLGSHGSVLDEGDPESDRVRGLLYCH